MNVKWKTTLKISALLIGIIIITNILVNVAVNRLTKEEISRELVNYSTLAVSYIDKYYPGAWKSEGENLYKGDVLLNGNNEAVDGFTKDTGLLAAIYAGDKVISVSVKDDKGSRQTDIKASEKVIHTVLKGSKPYQVSASIAGSDADTYYVPLSDDSGSAVGMLLLGINSDKLNKKADYYLNILTLIQIGFIIIGSAASYYGAKYIAHGFNRIKDYLEELENGNFNIQFNSKLAERKDEIGNITRSFINMQKKINGIITSIKDEAANIESSSIALADGADIVYNDIEDISSTTEELSAGMEETAASTQEMNATSTEIDNEISRVSDKAANGLGIAAEIKKRAANLKETALISKKTADEIYDKTNKKLRQSIEKAAAINEIKSLSQTILNITAQTNLLALNASIESARAGEAGKGFAVVAHEIGTLAQNSKNAVSKIDSIINEISDAVDDIVNDSKLLLEFVDTKVIQDYEVLVHTGEQYDTDANVVEAMVSDIKNSSTQLKESVHYVREAINEVTLATTEGSKGSTEIAEKSSSIFHKTNDVLDQATKNKEIASHLSSLIQFFKL